MVFWQEKTDDRTFAQNRIDNTLTLYFKHFTFIFQLVIFIVYAVRLKGTPYEVTANSGVPLDSPLIYNPARRYEAWRYLTYMFIHSG